MSHGMWWRCAVVAEGAQLVSCPVSLPKFSSLRTEIAVAWVWVGDMLRKISSDLSCPLASAPWVALEPLP